MATVLTLVNNVPRSVTSNAVLVVIYDQRYVVASAITTGTAVTLPSGQTYTGAELQVYLNGDRIEATYDYTYVGTGSGKTQVSFTFNLVIGDVIDFRIDRLP